MKKIIRRFLVFAAVLLSLAGTAVKTEAASNPYPLDGGHGVAAGNCTWRAWQEVYERLGIALPAWGNAKNWYGAAQNSGYKVVPWVPGNYVPSNSVAVWGNGTYGHVAFVESADANGFTLIEGNFSPTVENPVYHSYWRQYWRYGSRSSGLIGFITFDAPAQVSLSFGEDNVQPKENDAYIYTKAMPSVSGTFTEVGITIWNADGAVVGTKTEYISTTYSYLNIWYNLTEELGIVLNRGSYYTYQFYTVFNGVKYTDSVKSFWTAGERVIPLKSISLNRMTATIKVGDTVKLAVSYNPSNTTDSKTVVWTSEDPSIATVKNGVVTGLKKGVATIKAKVGSTSAYCTVKVTENVTENETSFPFTDVTKKDYYYDPVAWAVGHDITTGVTATLYKPLDGCTRGQVVTFLWRAAGEPKAKTTSCPFKDVQKGTYYYDAVLWAVERGITTGVTSTAFVPDAVCTRGQIVTFLWRYEGKQGAASSKNEFSDVANNAYYYNAVLWAKEQGVTTGVTKTQFMPDKVCTRGEIVTFLFRAM